MDDAALRARVEKMPDGVIVLFEVPVPTADTADTLFDVVEELTGDVAQFCLLIDLSEAGRPTAEVRAVLKRRFAALRGKLRHVAVFIEENVVLRTAAKFVMRTMLDSVSIHSKRDEALAAIKACL